MHDFGKNKYKASKFDDISENMQKILSKRIVKSINENLPKKNDIVKVVKRIEK